MKMEENIFFVSLRNSIFRLFHVNVGIRWGGGGVGRTLMETILYSVNKTDSFNNFLAWAGV